LFQGGQFLICLLQEFRVLLFPGQLKENLGVFQFSILLPPSFDFCKKAFFLLQDFLCFLGVVPEIRAGRELLQRLNSFFFLVQVKDGSLRQIVSP